MISPLPGATALKPGSATKPFFGVKPLIVNEKGERQFLGIQAGEKVYQDFRIEATNPGGHSSRPRPDNAIYELAAALVRIGQYEFPVQFNDTTRAFFTQMAAATAAVARTDTRHRASRVANQRE